jgi:hypothetical protein
MPGGLRDPRFDRPTDSATTLALDKATTRSFDVDGRMHISKCNISKATVNPYKGEEIPGWEELGLEPTRVYQMFRSPDELAKSAPTFNRVQLLKKHVPVDVDDHQMWDIVGTTGSDAEFDGTYLTNSLAVWTKEGIDFIESGEQRELSCGYHYVPVMTSGIFDGKRFDGIMTEIKGNHVALVEEGRAGHDVVVGDSAISEREDEMKPTRLEYAVLMRTARAINPLLAQDAKVDYAPILKGLSTKNFKTRKPQIVDGLRKALTGKTIAKDASIEHLAKMLDHFEGSPAQADESVSGSQHRAMEAAAHGSSNLDIPKSVGEEFSKADKGKTFGDMIRDWSAARDWSNGMDEAGLSELEKMHGDCSMDSEEETESEEEAEDKHADDKKAHDKKSAKDRKAAKDSEKEDEEKAEDEFPDKKDEEAEDDFEEAEDKHADDRHADDRARDSKRAKDKKGAMDKRSITQDEVNKAIEAAVAGERKRSKLAQDARAFVRPFVGEVVGDSAEAVLRAGAKALNIDDAEKLHVDALRPLISVFGKQRIEGTRSRYEPDLAMDAADGDAVTTFNQMFGADRIRPV